MGHGDGLCSMPVETWGSQPDEPTAVRSVVEKLRGAVGDSWACCSEHVMFLGSYLL